MDKVQAYLEAVVKDGFDREIGQDENVVRSLPFFATSLGILASAFALARPSLCAPSLDPLALGVYGALAALGCSAALTILFLFRLSVARRYSYPMPEGDFIALARGAMLDARTRDPAGTDEEVEAAVMDELRDTRIEQLAEAASVNRRNNVIRNRVRSLALTMLISAIGFAFLLLALIFLRDTLAPELCRAGRP